VKRLPELFPVLQVLLDRPGTPARFLLLSSASPHLVRGVTESLAGRVAFVDMRGFPWMTSARPPSGRPGSAAGFPAHFSRPTTRRASPGETTFSAASSSGISACLALGPRRHRSWSGSCPRGQRISANGSLGGPNSTSETAACCVGRRVDAWLMPELEVPPTQSKAG